MRYLCAVYLRPEAYAALSPAEMAELDRDSVRYDQELAKAGKLVAAAALQPASTAKTLRQNGGKAVVLDGPFAETKEVLGGFLLIEARDMEEAVRIAQTVPVAKYGAIEVREEKRIG